MSVGLTENGLSLLTGDGLGLTENDFVGLTGFSFLEQFADASDDFESLVQSVSGLFAHEL